MKKVQSAECRVQSGLLAPKMSLVKLWCREGWLQAAIAEGKVRLAGFERGTGRPRFRLTLEQQEELLRAQTAARAAWATLSKNVNERRAA